MLQSLSFSPPVCFHFMILLFFPCPLQSTCLLFPAIFSYTQTIPFTMLLSGKQAPLICQASSPCFFKLVLFHTSFIVLSHSLHLISSILKYLSCLELILLPLILSHQRQTVFAESHVCMWFPTAMGHVLMLFFRQESYQFKVVGLGFFVIVE